MTRRCSLARLLAFTWHQLDDQVWLHRSPVLTDSIKFLTFFGENFERLCRVQLSWTCLIVSECPREILPYVYGRRLQIILMYASKAYQQTWHCGNIKYFDNAN